MEAGKKSELIIAGIGVAVSIAGIIFFKRSQAAQARQAADLAAQQNADLASLLQQSGNAYGAGTAQVSGSSGSAPPSLDPTAGGLLGVSTGTGSGAGSTSTDSTSTGSTTTGDMGGESLPGYTGSSVQNGVLYEYLDGQVISATPVAGLTPGSGNGSGTGANVSLGSVAGNALNGNPPGTQPSNFVTVSGPVGETTTTPPGEPTGSPAQSSLGTPNLGPSTAAGGSAFNPAGTGPQPVNTTSPITATKGGGAASGNPPASGGSRSNLGRIVHGIGIGLTGGLVTHATATK